MCGECHGKFAGLRHTRNARLDWSTRKVVPVWLCRVLYGAAALLAGVLAWWITHG